MEQKKRGERWYDKHPELADNLEALKGVPRRRRESIFAKLLHLLRAEAPQAVAKAEAQPRPEHGRRWYDGSTQPWTAVSALQYSDINTIARSAALLGDEIAQSSGAREGAEDEQAGQAAQERPAAPAPQELKKPGR